MHRPVSAALLLLTLVAVALAINGGSGTPEDDDSMAYNRNIPDGMQDKIKKSEGEFPVAARATFESVPGWQMKKYPGVKSFVNEHMGRFPSGVIDLGRGKSPVLTLFDKTGQKIASYSFNQQSKADEILDILARHGIVPGEKRRF